MYIATERNPSESCWYRKMFPLKSMGSPAILAGHYVDGLRYLGCVVDLVAPPSQYAFNNPWNSTAEMMMMKLETFHAVLAQDYDVVHVVLPLNVSGLWLLAACKVKRALASADPTAHKTIWSFLGIATLLITWKCTFLMVLLANFSEAFIGFAIITFSPVFLIAS